jgi:hypothetical protein
MSHLLFDIFPIDLALEKSLDFLNKSILSNSQKILKKNLEILGDSRINTLCNLAKNNQIVDSPVSWYGMHITKVLTIKELRTQTQINFTLSIIEELTNPGLNSLKINISYHRVSGFEFFVPLDFDQKINPKNCFEYQPFSDWQILSSLKEYENWKKSLFKAIHLINTIDSRIISFIDKLIHSLWVVMPQEDIHGSGSNNTIIGAIYLPVVDDDSLLAECLIHEALHTYLYRLDHMYPLFEGSSGEKDIYYSPWRDDPRPLSMILHGAFVFTGVLLFYKSLFEKSCKTDEAEKYMMRIAVRLRQVEIAMDVLKTHNFLSKLGTSIIEIMSNYLEGMPETAMSIEEEKITSDHKAKFSNKNYFHHFSKDT